MTETTDKSCASCTKRNATRNCGLCSAPLCSTCSKFLSPQTFRFVTPTPAQLSHTHYCDDCFEESVAPEISVLESDLEAARQVAVFMATQTQRVPSLQISRLKVEVQECTDEPEVLLRLAYLAVKKEFNAIAQVEVRSKKVRNEGYQTSVWSGSATLATVDIARLERMRY